MRSLLFAATLFTMPAVAKDFPIYISGIPHPAGYCATIRGNLAATAGHIIANTRKLNQATNFEVEGGPCIRLMLCNDADLCLLHFKDEVGEETEVTAELGQLVLQGQEVTLQKITKRELYVDWEDWIQPGMSGSGVYSDGKLLAVLSRMKRGEYAVAVLLAPYLDSK